MKLILISLWLCSAYILFAQNDSGKFYNQPDSTRININEEIAPPVDVNAPFFVPLRAVNSIPLSLRMGLNSLSPVMDDDFRLNTDLLYPSMPLRERNKLSFLYTMLGAVQTGAVGYLAYKHIKKFGLFK